MVNFPSGYLESKLYARALQRWADAVRKAATVDLATLRRQRSRARLLRAQLDRLIHRAEDRLALPRKITCWHNRVLAFFLQPRGKLVLLHHDRLKRHQRMRLAFDHARSRDREKRAGRR